MPISDLTGPVTSTGSATAIADGAINVSKLSGKLPIANGGTGKDTASDAFYALSPSTLITYTGTPKQKIYFSFLPGCGVIPASTTIGQAAYVADGGPVLSLFIYVEGGGSGGLQTISFDDFLGAQSFGIQNCAELTSLSFPELVVFLNTPTISTLPMLTTLSLPKLETCMTGFGATILASLTTLSLPALKYVNGSFTPSVMASLTTLSAPLLEFVGINFGPNTMALLTTLSFPALKYISGNFAPATMAAVTSISLPAMVAYGTTSGSTFSVPSASMANVAAFTMGTIGTLKSIGYATLTLSGLKLPSSEVNAILALLVSLDGTNGTTLWGAGKTLLINGGTNGAPTGQGITDKATLQARGATVTTN